MLQSRFARYFLEVAGHGSIRRASERLHVAASAINRQILNAEESLGLALFERSRTGLRLTRAGQALFEHLGRSAGQDASLARFLADLRTPGGGEIRLAVADGLAASFIPEVCMRLRDRFPRMRFAVTVANAASAAALVRANSCDLALTFDPPTLAGLSVMAEIAATPGVLLPAGHRLAGQPSVTLADCKGEPLIAPDDSTALRQMLDRLFVDEVPALNVVFSSNNVALLCDMVARGLGIAILRDLDAAGLTRDQPVRFVPLAMERAPTQRLWMVTAAETPLPENIAAVIAALRVAFLGLAAPESTSTSGADPATPPA